MVDECTYMYANGRKCRRIPKRGQSLCPAHRPSRRPRGFLEENDAFNQQMSAWVEQLRAMELTTFLSQTQAALCDLQPLIDRRLSRRDRAAYSRATIAVTVAIDRLDEAEVALRAPSPAASRTASPGHPLTPHTAAAVEAVRSAQLSPQQLDALCNQMLSILEPNASTTSTLHANR
ncbi:MAG: hypothetical protein WA891_05350 [Acidobacteriaceae bacterium]